MNISSPDFLIIFNIQAITKYPKIEVLKNAKTRIPTEILLCSPTRILTPFNPAKIKIGSPAKKLKLAKISRFIPKNCPVAIIIPDLETPGSSAKI